MDEGRQQRVEQPSGGQSHADEVDRDRPAEVLPDDAARAAGQPAVVMRRLTPLARSALALCLSLAQGAREGAYLLSEQLRNLQSSEMSATGHLRPARHPQEALAQLARRIGQIFGEGRDPSRNLDVLSVRELWR